MIIELDHFAVANPAHCVCYCTARFAWHLRERVYAQRSRQLLAVGSQDLKELVRSGAEFHRDNPLVEQMAKRCSGQTSKQIHALSALAAEL